MKNLILCVLLATGMNQVFSQTNPCPTNIMASNSVELCNDTVHDLCLVPKTGHWYRFDVTASGQVVSGSMVSGNTFEYKVFETSVTTPSIAGGLTTSFQETLNNTGIYYIMIIPGAAYEEFQIDFTPDDLCGSLPLDTCPTNLICEDAIYICNDTAYALCEKGESWYSFDVDDPNQSISLSTTSGGIFGTRIFGPITGNTLCDQSYLNSVLIGSNTGTSYQHNFSNTGLYYMLVKNGDLPNSLLIDFTPDIACDKLTTPCPTNLNCEDALSLCRDTIHDLCDRNVPIWYTFEVKTPGQALAGSMLSGNPFTYVLYGPVNTSIHCTQYNWNALQIAGLQTTTFQETINTIGTYYLVITPITPNEQIQINFRPDELCDLCPSNSDCNNPMVVCEDTKHTISCKCYEVGPKGEVYYPPLYYVFDVANPSQSVHMSTMVPSNNCNESRNGFDRIEFYGPLPSNLDLCRDLPNYLLQSYVGVPSASIIFANPGRYVAVVQPSGCDPKCPTGPDNIDVIIDFRPDDPCDRIIKIDSCETCIGSFAPIPDEEYVISAWASEKNAPFSKSSFDQPYIEIRFPGAGTVGPFYPSGNIIDGWQRIEGSFKVPLSATNMAIDLKSNSGKVLFDDVRVFPFNASMKSYVYDPINMRLVAELDERNYATFYEYDDEGKLSRIKKETEKGVMTIQETKQNTTKTP